MAKIMEADMRKSSRGQGSLEYPVRRGIREWGAVTLAEDELVMACLSAPLLDQREQRLRVAGWLILISMSSEWILFGRAATCLR